MRFLRKALIAFFAVLMIIACGDGGSSNPTEGVESSENESPDNKSSEKSGGSKTTEKSSSSRSKSSSSSQKNSSSLFDRCDVETDENCFEDSRDGQTYRTVKIGRQVWMAENLKYEYRYDRATLCCGDSTENCEKYGRLYTWAAAVDYSEKECSEVYCDAKPRTRGACPYGWHLPDTTEWNILFSELSGPYKYFFSPHPAGNRTYNDPYGSKSKECWNIGKYGYFWSSTQYFKETAYRVRMDTNDTNFELDKNSKYYAFSVRCIKD